ncbi:hypothetical protein PBI_THONKO_34 [Mycobacterium phage Thonko]|uniref:Uncharacterized protein n=1 Tax=Mycobacterium phage Thonko TaxID=2282910 RepID=A0A346FC81_9CAUD|nr:hypothetical protein I5G57_gp034 [Mycobacterium phage Thonko]AXN53306.1 hypothetical protein PBI_THONKO_34 [Mycobacterium phage Thonko]
MSLREKAKAFIKETAISIIEDPRTETALRGIVARVVLPIIPVAVGAAVDRAADRLTDLDQDGKPDIGEVVDAARDGIDKLLPPGINLPVIGDLNEFVGGFLPNFGGR